MRAKFLTSFAREMFAPRSSRALTTSMCPSDAARVNPVDPFCLNQLEMMPRNDIISLTVT